MRVTRLFVDSELAVASSITLTESRAHYVKHVLRLRPGDAVTLFNGSGGEYRGRISRLEKAGVEIAIEAFADQDRESPLAIELGLGITKRDAMDTAIQKVTELGATRITPVVSEFTDVPKRALLGRHQHWLHISRSACEQCGRTRPPLLDEAVPLDAWLDKVDADAKFVAHPGAAALEVPARPPRSIALLTGPEGGFSEREVDQCVAAGFRAVALGPRILRADTAPTVLITLIQAQFGDLGANPG